MRTRWRWNLFLTFKHRKNRLGRGSEVSKDEVRHHYTLEWPSSTCIISRLFSIQSFVYPLRVLGPRFHLFLISQIETLFSSGIETYKRHENYTKVWTCVTPFEPPSYTPVYYSLVRLGVRFIGASSTWSFRLIFEPNKKLTDDSMCRSPSWKFPGLISYCRSSSFFDSPL